MQTDHMPNRQTAHESRAYDLGAEHARATASWVTDGNTSESTVSALLEDLTNGVYDFLPTAPNLSGEYADDLTPRRLFEDVTGMDAHAEATWNADAYHAYLEALCDAYEAGVSDTFETECERILRAALED